MAKDLQDGGLGFQSAVNTQASIFDQAVSTRHCPEHPKEGFQLYCSTCEELVCLKCAIKGGRHHDHDHKKIDEAFQEYVGPMEKQMITLTQLDTRSGEISERRKYVESKIHIAFTRLREALEVREPELISQLDQMTHKKLKCLAAQKDYVEITLEQLNSEKSKEDVLMMKSRIAKQKLTKTNMEPSDLEFLAPVEFIAACADYGQVFASTIPDPSKCEATGKGTKEAVVGEESTCIVHAKNFEGKSIEVSLRSLDGDVFLEESGRTKATYKCTMKGNEQSQHEISYQPSVKGKHQLHIKAEGQHIIGSPFNVAEKLPRFGTPKLCIDGVGKPWGIVINHTRTHGVDPELVVTEEVNACVSVFSLRGEKLRSFGEHGSGKGQFDGPIGVAVDGEGEILVVDSRNHRIQKFTADGCFLTEVGTKGSKPLQFSNPTGIAVNNSKVYVVDTDNNRVQVLNGDLTFSHTFGKKGTRNNQFSYPHGIACDSDGMVYVTDRDNHRIKVFTAEGKFLRKFGQHGQDTGGLDCPVGVAVDTNGMVYVSEATTDRVSLFNSNGQHVESFGKKGDDPGYFNLPTALSLDTSAVYVCDLNNRVQVFDY